MSDKPKRDWVKEPYNTWDDLAAMAPLSMPTDKQDIKLMLTRLDRIESLLVSLVETVSKLDADHDHDQLVR